MRILAIDPGPTKSAWLIFDTETQSVGSRGIEENEVVIERLRRWTRTKTIPTELVIEKIQSLGMAVGATVFETVFWTGRFYEAWEDNPTPTRIGRGTIKMHLCNSMRARDSNIRQALIDRFGPPGTKKEPGVTHGISKDLWSALAVAVTYADLHCK